MRAYELEQAERVWYRVQKIFDLDLFAAWDVDEISVLYKDRHELSVAGDVWAMHGAEKFNEVNDAVGFVLPHLSEGYEGPVTGSYDVHYDFWRLPERTWRIEGMAVTTGTSPVHAQALARSGGEPTVVHASWKAVTHDNYMRDCTAMANLGYKSAQECSSSYGRFSYFYDEKLGVYLKPRWNRGPQSLTSGS